MRKKDWQLQFASFVKERAAMPFAWGSNDCCIFAADAALAMTGVDVAADLRGTYDDARGAVQVLEERGGMLNAASAAFGEAIAPVMAGVGDIVLLVNEGRQLLAVCNGMTAIGPGADGMAVLDMQSARAAWRI